MLIGLIALLTLIFVHELGHLLAAKYFGKPVVTFSLGFGPVLFERQLGKTVYRVSLLPLGGYVRFARSEYDAAGQERNFILRLLVPRTKREELLSRELSAVVRESENSFFAEQMILFSGPAVNLAVFLLCIWLY
jgi:RIP metalloprotease RseP